MAKLRRLLGLQVLPDVLSRWAQLPSPGAQPALRWQQDSLWDTDVNSLCTIPKSKSCWSPQPFRGAVASPRWHKRDTKIFPCSCTVMDIFQEQPAMSWTLLWLTAGSSSTKGTAGPYWSPAEGAGETLGGLYSWEPYLGLQPDLTRHSSWSLPDKCQQFLSVTIIPLI